MTIPFLTTKPTKATKDSEIYPFTFVLFASFVVEAILSSLVAASAR